MNEVPYLLRGIAERVLGNNRTASVTVTELARQGYDVPTLLMMIEAYGKLSPAERTMDISQTHEVILFQRRAESPDKTTSLRLPRLSTAPAKPPAQSTPAPVSISAPPPLEEILRRALTAKKAPAVPAPKKP